LEDLKKASEHPTQQTQTTSLYLLCTFFILVFVYGLIIASAVNVFAERLLFRLLM